MDPLLTQYLEALVRLVTCAAPDVAAAADVLAACEATEPVQGSRVFRFIRQPEPVLAWLLRYAVGSAVGHACDARVSRSFGVAAATEALGARLGSPVALVAAALPLLRTGVLVRTSDAALSLPTGLENYLLGAPLEGAGLLPWSEAPRGADVPELAEAARRLQPLLLPGRPVVLHAPDAGVAQALAAAVSALRGRSLEAFAYTGDDDPVPALRQASDAGGFDVFLQVRPFRSAGMQSWAESGRSGGQSLLFVLAEPDDDGTDSLLDPDPPVDLTALCTRVGLAEAARPATVPDRDARALALHQAVYPEAASIPPRPARAEADAEPHLADRLWQVPDCTLDDLVLAPPVRAAFDAIVRSVRAGRRVVTLLHGPPGTGKSLTARGLAGTLGRPLYRLQGGLVRGRWYGEIESRIDAVMAEVVRRGAVLLIDEADEWLGRREGSAAQVGSGHIVECSYMLQALEHFEGVAVLTTNRSEVMDPALSRRMDAWIHLPLPELEERMALWVLALGADSPMRGSDLLLLASIPISGGEIAACVREVALAGGELRTPALVASARRRAERWSLLGDGSGSAG